MKRSGSSAAVLAFFALIEVFPAAGLAEPVPPPPAKQIVALPKPIRTPPPVPDVDRNRPVAPKTPPSKWVSITQYPMQSLRRREEGEVRYRLLVGPDGRTRSCEILVSSGSQKLDEWTCLMVSRYARFIPATDDQGNAITVPYENSMNWTLPAELPPNAED